MSDCCSPLERYARARLGSPETLEQARLLPWPSSRRYRRARQCRFGRGPGIGSVTYETLALPMAKEASREPALGRVLVVLSDSTEPAPPRARLAAESSGRGYSADDA